MGVLSVFKKAVEFEEISVGDKIRTLV